MMQHTNEPQVIDVHGHYGRYERDTHELIRRFSSAPAEAVARRGADCGVGLTIVSPLLGLLPRFQASAFDGNREAYETVRDLPALRQWVIIDPRDPRTYDQADQMLNEPWVVGIKIHPEEHGYPIREHGEAIFRFAAERNAVVLSHTGEANSLPGDIVPFADAHPSATVILAHLGFGPGNDPSHQVRAIQASKAGNVYADTSSVLSVLPGLIEWAVKQVGAERLMFGSDTPLYHVANQKARIEAAEISDRDKQRIFCGTALAVIDKLTRSDSPQTASV